MSKYDLIEIVADLYIQGYSSEEIARKLPEICQSAKKLPSARTIREWIRKHRAEWELRKKQKEILKIQQKNQDAKTLIEQVQEEVHKADALDYQDLCDLQKRYKEIAMKEYKPRAVEIVIQCIKLKREIREGLKGDEANKVQIELKIPDKTWDTWQVEEE